MTIYETTPILEQVVEYRRQNPRSRVTSLFRHRVNTSATKQMECVLCGESGPSWCSRYPKTRRSSDWEIEHRQEHQRAH